MVISGLRALGLATNIQIATMERDGSAKYFTGKVIKEAA